MNTGTVAFGMPSFALFSTEEALKRLQSSESGLSENTVEERRGTDGWNEIPIKKRSRFVLFLNQFHDVLIYILLAALVLSLLLPFMEEEAPTLRSFTDAFVIFGILLLNALLGFVQEFRAEKAIELLQKLTAPLSRVRRDGSERMIASRELVPGDIVIIDTGDRISADCRIIQESHLEIDESSFTGESQTVKKSTSALTQEGQVADMHNMVFSGTVVTRGSAEAVITAIGPQTEIGKLAAKVSEVRSEKTPLEKRMERLSKLLGVIVLSLSIILILIGIWRGLPLKEIFLIGISFAVSAVPEGLPAIITVCFAIGVRRMARRNALVRRLDALETLGSVTVICSDKTGTITQNKMTVVETWLTGGEEQQLKLLAVIGASNNRAVLPNIGDPTEIALLEFAEQQGVKRLPIDEEEVPFSSEEKFMQTRHGDRVFYKGAPEKIFQLTDENEEAEKKADDMSTRGLRVLAMAVQEAGDGRPRIVGLAGMEDPPRSGVKGAVALARLAGIRTIMITGDHGKTASAIANQIGIHGEILLGKELDQLSPEHLAQRVKTVSVFARVSPLHKLAILDALKKNNEIIAMTGDGVNDAPALKGAHVGIAMGKVGTQVAREASSIVLADDDYETLVNAIRAGRHIYDNVRKFVLFLLRSNFDEMLFLGITLGTGLPIPYHPIHLLWINLMTDSLPALALGMEPEERDIMRRKPRNPAEGLLTGEWGRLAIATLISFSIVFIYYLYQLYLGAPIEEIRSEVVILAIIIELLMAMSSRSAKPIWRIGLFSNPWMLGALTMATAIQLLVLYSPLSGFLYLIPPTLEQWWHMLLLGVIAFMLFEGMKVVMHGKK